MQVQIRLLGGFEVTEDGVAVPPEAWTRRHAASLVKLLALSRGRRMHREQVIDARWPGLSVGGGRHRGQVSDALGPGLPGEAGGPRLHKAAHYARRILGDDPTSVVLRNEVVSLLPGHEVGVDVEELHRRGRHALDVGT